MKTFKNCGLALAIAAALTMTTGLTACSSENDLVETPNVEQPTQPTTDGVKITVSAGIADDATTRSEVATEDGKRVLKFTTGDRLYVYGEIDASTSVAGLLTMDGAPTNSNKSATFTGTIKAYDNSGAEISYDFGSNDPLALCTRKTAKATLVHEALNTNAISITLGKDAELYTDYMYAANVETLMTTSLPVQGDYNGTGFTLSSECPIINCTLTGLTAGTSYEVGFYYEGPSVWIQSFRNSFTADANGTISVAFASYYSGNKHWKINVLHKWSVSDPLDFDKDIDLDTRELTAKIYNVRRNYGRAAFGKFVDISTLSVDFEAQDGDVLSGTLANNVKISIAAGAMVTLSGATIPGRNATDDNTQWAGITCLGDATIVLSDGSVNSVKGYHAYYPGIQAGPAGTTLTIRGGTQGNGTLTATTGMSFIVDQNIGGAAGIGGGFNMTVGNIRIEGGNITANGDTGAGIGCGQASEGDAACGDITITGGTINATGGISGLGGGAGIGSGSGVALDGYATCGKITITGGTITAKGMLLGAGIGSGDNYSKCGGITITGGTGKASSIGAGSQGTCGTINVAENTISGPIYENGEDFLSDDPGTDPNDPGNPGTDEPSNPGTGTDQPKP